VSSTQSLQIAVICTGSDVQVFRFGRNLFSYQANQFAGTMLFLQPMKPFAFIMAVMILVLGGIPCTDAASAQAAGKDKITLTHPGTDQNADHDDDCSPFCQCACCPGFSINHFVTATTELTIPECTNFSSYLPGVLPEICRPIWQPPKL
jgi:hypothetical protein